MKSKFIYWCALIALVFLFLPATAMAADNPPGVAYRGHIQDLGDYPTDGSWVNSPEIIGTTGQSKRIEGFEIKLTGDVPAGMELRYNVHVQNKGWLYDENDSTNWPKDGDYAGTRGEGLRIEAVKIVLTDSTGKSVSGYSVHYRGHVQNVGDLPASADTWYADGEPLGTVGSSQRLEALLVQVIKTAVAPVVYNKAGLYGSATEPQTIAGDVTIAADGVTLQNLVIEGNLTISEAVGNGTVTLNNVTVKGDTLVRGGGINSIHINGGKYRRIVMEKTASGAVRIVATDVDGLAVVISEDAAGESIILEGSFDSIVVNAPNMTVTTQGNTTTIGKLTVGVGAAGSTLNLATGTTITDLVLDGTAAVKGQGTVTRADVNADSVVFEMIPGSYAVESDVVIPPVFPTPNNGGGGGAGTPTVPVAVASITLGQTSIDLGMTKTAQLTATVLPANATNKTLTWTSSDKLIATVDSTGKVTGVSEGGPVTITATATNGKTTSGTVTVVPGYDVTIDGNNKATITKFYSTSTALTIPGTIDGVEVVAIGTAVFKGLGLTSVDIPASVTNIDPSAFEGCTQLTTVSFGAGSTLKIIDEKAFYGCTKLNTITLPAQLTTIGNEAFASCTSLTTLVLPASLITLGESAFSTTGLTAITIPNLVTIIQQFAFEKCPALTTVTLSANLRTLGSATFLDCDKLAEITIPASVNAIGVGAFHSCDSLTTVTFAAGSQLTEIPLEMFSECTKLTKVNFNNAPQITTIGDRAFLGCSQLVTIDLPNAVTEIDSQAFKACSELTLIDIPDKVTSIKGSAFENCTKLDTVSFGPGSQLTVIGDLAFRGCPKLINITIPQLVNTIGSGAFAFDAGTKTAACSYTFRGAAPATFTTNAIPTTPKPTIKYYANYQTGFDALFVSATEYDKQVILAKPTVTAATASYTSQPVVTLSWNAVADATTYDVLVSDTDGSFTGTPITVTGATLTTDISSGLTSGKTYYYAVKARDAYGESLLSDSRSALAPYLPVTSVTLDKTTLSVGVTKTAQLLAALLPASGTDPTVVWTTSDATIATVDENGRLTGINEGGPVTITAKSADGLKSDTCTVTVTEGYDVSVTANKATLTKYYGDNKDVVIPEQIEVNGVMRDVVAIKEGAFAITDAELQNGAHSITAVTIPASVTVIGASAFSNCRDLTTVTFAADSTLATIGDDAFNSCGILSAIEIPASVTSIGNQAFNACNALATVTFAADSQLTSIGDNVFNNCKFTTITIPASVTTIGSKAFQVCLSLTTVEFAPGSALTSIGQGAFYNCVMLSTIEIPAGVTTIDKFVFHACSISTVTFAAGSLLKTIDQLAFNSCPLTLIQNIPAGVIINANNATMGLKGSGFIAAYATGGSGTYKCIASAWTRQ